MKFETKVRKLYKDVMAVKQFVKSLERKLKKVD